MTALPMDLVRGRYTAVPLLGVVINAFQAYGMTALPMDLVRGRYTAVPL